MSTRFRELTWSYRTSYYSSVNGIHPYGQGYQSLLPTVDRVPIIGCIGDRPHRLVGLTHSYCLQSCIPDTPAGLLSLNLLYTLCSGDWRSWRRHGVYRGFCFCRRCRLRGSVWRNASNTFMFALLQGVYINDTIYEITFSSRKDLLCASIY